MSAKSLEDYRLFVMVKLLVSDIKVTLGVGNTEHRIKLL